MTKFDVLVFANGVLFQQEERAGQFKRVYNLRSQMFDQVDIRLGKQSTPAFRIEQASIALSEMFAELTGKHRVNTGATFDALFETAMYLAYPFLRVSEQKLKAVILEKDQDDQWRFSFATTAFDARAARKRIVDQIKALGSGEAWVVEPAKVSAP